MSKGLVRKLLILLVGVLLVLVAIFFQLQQNSKPKSQSITTKPQDMSSVLSASFQQQRRYFQRCWLRNTHQNSQNSTEEPEQMTWQIFIKIESTGKVKDFAILNKALFDQETEKCLKEISYRLKFPSFEGEDVAITVPIVISPYKKEE